jgi:hypothetical protein
VASAAASIMNSRISATSSTRSAGTSSYSKVMPISSSFQMIALFLTRSTTPRNSSSAPIGHLQRDRVGAETLLQLSDHIAEVRPRAIHLVDEHHARHVYLFAWRHTVSVCGCTPDEPHSTNYRAIQYAQGALDFNREVDVPGRVDDIDAVLVELLIHALPETGRRRRGNRDTPLLLLLHPVHGSGAVVHLADLVRQPRVKQDTLRGRGLASVNVSNDADIAITADRSFASHFQVPVMRWKGGFV